MTADRRTNGASGPAAILSLAHDTKDIPANSSSCQLAHTFSRCGPSSTSGLELNRISHCSPNIAVAGRGRLGNSGKKRGMQRKSESHCNHRNETNVLFWKRPINLLDMHSMAEVIMAWETLSSLSNRQPETNRYMSSPDKKRWWIMAIHSVI